jgi:hypothetical protein
MPVYRGAGGAGDATADASNTSAIALAAATAAELSAATASNAATTATTQAGTATTQASNAATSASNAASSASAAAASYDSFDDRYLGAKSSNPATDNDGNTLVTGALYWNSGSNEMKVWSGTTWVVSYVPSTGFLTPDDIGDTVQAQLPVGISGLVLTSNGLGLEPTWQAGVPSGTASNLAGGAVGQLPYQTGAGSTTFLPVGTNGQVLTLASGTPAWQTLVTLPSQSGNTGKFLTTNGSAASWAAIPSAFFLVQLEASM